jgi:hypothetical protein
MHKLASPSQHNIHLETKKRTKINEKNTAHENIFDILVWYEVAYMTLHSPSPLLNNSLKLITVSPWQQMCTVQKDQPQNSNYININHQYNYNQTSCHHHNSRQYHNILYNGILNVNNTTLVSTRQTIQERPAPICKHYIPSKQIYVHNFEFILHLKKRGNTT